MEVRLSIILLFILYSNLSFAYSPKEGNIFAAFGPTLMQTVYDRSSNQVSSGYKGDVGLFIQGDISDHGSLEISIFHFNKTFFREQEGQLAAEELEQIHIGLGYRHWVSRKFSLGWAFASSYAMSETKVVNKEPASNALDTSARDISEFCLDLSMQYLIWEKEESSVFLDLRYSRDTTARVGEQGDHLVGTIAFRQFIQGK